MSVGRLGSSRLYSIVQLYGKAVQLSEVFLSLVCFHPTPRASLTIHERDTARASQPIPQNWGGGKKDLWKTSQQALVSLPRSSAAEVRERERGGY